MRRQKPLDVKLWQGNRRRAARKVRSEKQHSLPVNVCLLRSSIMIRAAPWEVLGTSAAAGRSASGRSRGRMCLQDAANYGAIGNYVVVVVTPLAGQAGGRGAPEREI